MTSTKQVSNTRGETDDDNFIEDFARDFFGTNEPKNEPSISLPEKTRDAQVEKQEEKRKHEVHAAKIQPTYKKKSERKMENQRNASKKKHRGSSKTADPDNSSESSCIKRFLELKDEFLSLSVRLHDANLPNVSRKLTQVLTERQRLVKALLDMNNVSSSLNIDSKNEERQLHDRSGSKTLTGSSERDFGMPKKTKSVHWSDEHLGGSIILDPSLFAHQTSDSNYARVQTSGRHEESNYSKPPPRYKTVDRCTQTRSGRKRMENGHDLNQYHKMRVDLELEYVEAILNEAAELRREACGMIWRAHYLEQLCDVDGLVKHVYRSTSNVPTLPRYPHLYR